MTAKKKSTKSGYTILAIDQGTTGTAASLFSEDGRRIAASDRDFPQIYPRSGWVEHRPANIWDSVKDVVTRVLSDSGADPLRISGIGITNQRETVLAWDTKTGAPIGNALVWQDRRTADHCARLRADGFEKLISQRTGLVIDPYFSASKMTWLLDEAGLRSRAQRGEIRFGTIDSFLLWRLTGGAVHATDVSNASRTQLMNIDELRWDDELLALFQVPREVLPRIEDSATLFGVTNGLSFLPDGIPISGMAGDQQSALFGQACFNPGEVKCTFGTGSFLMLNTGARRVNSSKGLLTTVAWRLAGDATPTYALEGGAFICGAAVQFLRDQLGFIHSADEVEVLARSAPDSAGVEFVPALTGLGAPYWNPHARGVISGLSRGSTRAHIARATLEAMALQNADLLQAMDEDLVASGKKILSLRVDGGASRNNLLMQLQADYLAAEVIRPRDLETTSTGAAWLAGLGCGLYRDLEQVKSHWTKDRSFAPKLAAEGRTARLQRWHRAVSRALVVDEV